MNLNHATKYEFKKEVRDGIVYKVTYFNIHDTLVELKCVCQHDIHVMEEYNDKVLMTMSCHSHGYFVSIIKNPTEDERLAFLKKCTIRKTKL